MTEPQTCRPKSAVANSSRSGRQVVYKNRRRPQTARIGRLDQRDWMNKSIFQLIKIVGNEISLEKDGEKKHVRFTTDDYDVERRDSLDSDQMFISSIYNSDPPMRKEYEMLSRLKNPLIVDSKRNPISLNDNPLIIKAIRNINDEIIESVRPISARVYK